MTNPIEPARQSRPAVFAAGSVAAGVGALRRGFAPVVAWARLSKGSLRLGGADQAVALDSQSRGLLWRVLIETISAIGVLAAADGPLEEAMAALHALAGRVRAELAASPPRAVALPGAEPPQIFVLEILSCDLQPCLGHWQNRLAVWRATGRREADWSLSQRCRGDLARTRERLVERAWQLGMALGLHGLDRLLPERPAVAPVLTGSEELAAAEAAIVAPTDAGALHAGWQIYVEAATRIPARDLPGGPGILGEAIAAFDLLADEIRTRLKAMPPAVPGGEADTIQALAFRLLSEGIAPFLTEWRPRWHRFAASGRFETKWGRAAACRAALVAAIGLCLPIIRALGRKVGAPALPEPDASTAAADEAPLQLPPPAIRP